MKHFDYLKALFSPFRPFTFKLYIGKIKHGVPYFLPRRWVKDKNRPGYMIAKSIKWFGFNYTGLGWKTKFNDIRFEWAPMYSLVFFGIQFHLKIHQYHEDRYWESWLYYQYQTNKSKSKIERIKQCIKEAPCTWISYKGNKKETTDYYKLILKKKYIRQIYPKNQL